MKGETIIHSEKRYIVIKGSRGAGRMKISLEILAKALERGDDILILRKGRYEKVDKTKKS